MKTCNGCRTKKNAKSVLSAGAIGVIVGLIIGYLISNIK